MISRSSGANVPVGPVAEALEWNDTGRVAHEWTGPLQVVHTRFLAAGSASAIASSKAGQQSTTTSCMVALLPLFAFCFAQF